MIQERLVKQLQTQLNKMVADYEALKIEIASKQQESSQKKQAINKLKQQIDEADKKKEIYVSEHALVRYFERVKGFDIEEIKKEILSDSIKQMLSVLGGTGQYPNENGYGVILDNFRVTTII